MTDENRRKPVVVINLSPQWYIHATPMVDRGISKTCKIIYKKLEFSYFCCYVWNLFNLKMPYAHIRMHAIWSILGNIWEICILLQHYHKVLKTVIISYKTICNKIVTLVPNRAWGVKVAIFFHWDGRLSGWLQYDTNIGAMISESMTNYRLFSF